jgi:hypothetical protein
MPSFTPRPIDVEATPAADLIAGVKLGAVELPAWLEALRQAGRLRIRPDAVEVMTPAGVVLAGPQDVLVRHPDGAFPLRLEWFEFLMGSSLLPSSI